MPPPTRRGVFAAGAAASTLSLAAAVSEAETPPAAAGPAVTPALCRFILEARDRSPPEPILELGRLHILDTLASAVACRDLKPAILARRFAAAQSGDARRSAATMLATRERAALLDAAFASAMTAHAAEINDFIPAALVQPGPAVVSSVLGLAEQRGLDGAAVLRAVMVGYEIAGRVPKALGLRNLSRSGLANHGVGPVFGVGAAAASLLGLSEPQVETMLSYCSQQAAGSWQWLLDVEHVEKAFVFAGMGARAGLQAALFAEQGFTGVPANLDRPGGFLDQGMFTDPRGDLDRGALVAGLGEKWEMPQAAFKRYPTGGPIQPAVQGLLELLPQVPVDSVESVRIEMPGRWQAFRDAAMPALNLRYLSAIILIDRGLDFVSAQSLERMASDPTVRALMTKVEVVHDPGQEAPAGQPRVESARVIVSTKDGRRLERFTPFVRGFPSHPMTAAEVEAKAAELMTPRLGARRSRAVIAACRAIEQLKSAGELVRLIAT